METLPAINVKPRPPLTYSLDLKSFRGSDSCEQPPIPLERFTFCLFLDTPNLRIGVTLGFRRTMVVFYQAVLDTGAGPNFIRESVLPSNWREFRIRAYDGISHNVIDASNHALNTIGVVRLSTQLGSTETHA